VRRVLNKGGGALSDIGYYFILGGGSRAPNGLLNYVLQGEPISNEEDEGVLSLGYYS